MRAASTRMNESHPKQKTRETITAVIKSNMLNIFVVVLLSSSLPRLPRGPYHFIVLNSHSRSRDRIFADGGRGSKTIDNKN